MHPEEQHFHSNKRVPPPLFHSDTNPVFGHVLIHYFDKTHVLAVTVEFIWLLLLNIVSFNFSNAEQISDWLARFRRSYLEHPAISLTSHTSYKGA